MTHEYMYESIIRWIEDQDRPYPNASDVYVKRIAKLWFALCKFQKSENALPKSEVERYTFSEKLRYARHKIGGCEYTMLCNMLMLWYELKDEKTETTVAKTGGKIIKLYQGD